MISRPYDGPIWIGGGTPFIQPGTPGFGDGCGALALFWHALPSARVTPHPPGGQRTSAPTLVLSRPQALMVQFQLDPAGLLAMGACDLGLV